jgi:Pentapeptide repeats (8 copies)
MGQKSFKRFLALLYQPSLLLLGAGSILAFIALSARPSTSQTQEWRQAIWLSWGILFLFILVWRSLGWYLSPAREFEQSKDVVDLFTKITTSVLLILSITLTWFGIRSTQKATDKNLELARTTLENNLNQQADERFTSALEALGGERDYERIAGIYSFGRMESQFKSEAEYSELSKKAGSPEELAKLETEATAARADHGEIMRILENFIQENAAWDKRQTLNPNNKPRADIRLILKVIGTRKLGEDRKLVLVGTDLRKHDFPKDANFEGILFWHAHLEGAKLAQVKLKGASFWDAHLEGVDLTKADLTDVDFNGTHLEGAVLTDAKVGEDQLDLAIVDRLTTCPSGLKYESGRCVKS